MVKNRVFVILGDLQSWEISNPWNAPILGMPHDLSRELGAGAPWAGISISARQNQPDPLRKASNHFRCAQ